MEEKHPKGFIAGLREFLKALEEAEKRKGWIAGTGEFSPAGFKIQYKHRVKVLGLEGNEHAEAGYPIDISKKGSRVLLEVKLPKTKERDVNLKVVGDSLRIRAKTPKGEIQRDIQVGKCQKIKRIEKAGFKNGILRIELSKKGGNRERRLGWLKLRR